MCMCLDSLIMWLVGGWVSKATLETNNNCCILHHPLLLLACCCSACLHILLHQRPPPHNKQADESALLTAVPVEAPDLTWAMVWREADKQGNLIVPRCQALKLNDGEFFV